MSQVGLLPPSPFFPYYFKSLQEISLMWDNKVPIIASSHPTTVDL